MKTLSFSAILVACSVAASLVEASVLFVPHFPLSRQSSSQCGRRHNLSTFSRQSIVENDTETGDGHIFLRFSPLIGGPAILPLHVELIFAVEDANVQQIKQKMDTVYVRKANNLSSISFLKDASQLHRFDFLPKNPTDTSTLVRLLTLQGVPGRVRYRNYGGSSKGLNNIQPASNDEQSDGQDERGVTILIPVGSLSGIGDMESRPSDVLSSAISFKDEYSETLFRELRVLGGKNCLSFALDLLFHVESSSGLQRINRLNKLDIE